MREREEGDISGPELWHVVWMQSSYCADVQVVNHLHKFQFQMQTFMKLRIMSEKLNQCVSVSWTGKNVNVKKTKDQEEKQEYLYIDNNLEAFVVLHWLIQKVKRGKTHVNILSL